MDFTRMLKLGQKGHILLTQIGSSLEMVTQLSMAAKYACISFAT
jgi:hypothetical protein